MDTPEQVVSEIRQRINALCNFNGETLKAEMQELKKALLANPAACSLLLPEDIGAMVGKIREMTNIAAVAASEKTSKSKKGSTKLTQAELNAQIALIPDEEL